MSKWGLLKVVYDEKNVEVSRVQSPGKPKGAAIREAAAFLREHSVDGHAVKVVMFEAYE